MGVCFGHQIVGRALGVGVGRSETGWEMSVCGVELTGRGREVLGVAEGEGLVCFFVCFYMCLFVRFVCASRVLIWGSNLLLGSCSAML